MRKAFVQVALVIAITTMISTSAMASMAEELLIKPGDYNENVIVLHRKLSELGVYKLRPESPWGPDSVEALRVIQSVLGLEETGTVTDQSELDTILNLEATDELKAEIAAAQIVDNLFVNPEYSAGAESTDDGYVFTTSVEDNRFSYTAWQVYGPEGYLGPFAKGEIGITEGDYVFPYESGDYRIVFKGNTNLKDEGLTATIRLEKDVTYHYVSVVESLEPQRVVVSNVAFGVKK